MARPAPKPRKYEMMIVVAPTVTEDGLPNVVERVNGMIEELGGTIESFTHDSPWGHRRLAYPIQNFRDAFYVLYYFDVVPSAIVELDRELRLDDAVIRHLIVKFDPLTVRELGPEDDDDEEMDDDDTMGDDVDEDEGSTDDDSAAEEETSDDDADDAPDDDDADEGDDSDDDADESEDADDDQSGDDDEASDDDDDASEDDDEASDNDSDDGEDDSDDNGEDDEEEK